MATPIGWVDIYASLMVYHFSHLEFVKHYVRMTESNFPGSSKLFERAMLNLINQIKSIPATLTYKLVPSIIECLYPYYKKLLKENKENELSTYQYFCLLSSKSFGIFQRPEDIAVECQLLICRQNGLQSEHILIRHTDTTENITFQ